MRFSSIFVKLNLFFAVALIATIAAGVLTLIHFSKRDQAELLIQSRLLMRQYRATHTKPVDLIREFGLVDVPPRKWQPILRSLKKKRRHARLLHRRFGAARVLSHGGYLYLWMRARDFKMLLRQRQGIGHKMLGAALIFGAMLFLIGGIYLLLRRSLLPIRRLQQDIVRYGAGHLPEAELFSSREDEIAQVGNAFYASAHRTQRLMQSRQLFVRNIFHELNTPVTKGKILAELVDDPKTQSMLDSIFSRLASLLKELGHMEQVTASDTVLTLRPVRVIELIDQARDLLYLEEPIPGNIAHEQIEADFPTMSIAFKNLIDNGRKYGKNLTILSGKDGIDFVSDGAPLSRPLHAYTTPFSAGDAHQGDGFGLGLYIVDAIAKKHGMTLRYRHESGKNIFTLARP